ncbi:enoyl-CoA hydratase [Chromatiales bacterium (ex Bugula neritina AB1)]|nr:enoyl-CoA hydratase [Chromatiales bacterium (ex Bugula neritina AB1)]
MTPDYLIVQKEDNIATLTLNRPDKFNALSAELLTQLSAALDDIKTDQSISVVIIAAHGRAFCAGHDLRQMRANHSEPYYQELFNQCSRMMQQIATLPQPVIARVQGLATAAGCQLVATCDLAVASDNARFAVSGVNLGLFCSTPAVALSRNVSRKRAFEMLVTGDFIDSATAVEYGLINHAVAADKLDSAVASLAEKIAGKPKSGISVGKQLFYSQLSRTLPDAYQQAADVMACNMMSEETVEHVDAFLEKRPPQFSS